MKIKKNRKIYFNVLLLTTILLSLLISITVKAGNTGEGFRLPVYEKQKSNSKSSQINWKGYIRCSQNSHKSGGQCDLEFYRGDGKVFSILRNPKLVALHCSNHKDIKIDVKGLVKEDFLFHSNVLYVKDFKVIADLKNSKKEQTIRVTDKKSLKK